MLQILICDLKTTNYPKGNTSVYVIICAVLKSVSVDGAGTSLTALIQAYFCKYYLTLNIDCLVNDSPAGPTAGSPASGST